MPVRTQILDVSERRAFRTIYEAINWCVGTDYKYWGRACWPRVQPTDGFRLWFTQLAYVERGRYVPATFDCINLICCNGNYHVFDKVNPKEPDVMSSQTWKYDLIFSKEVGGSYFFRGVFISDTEHSAMHHYVSKRIATKVKLIGCPARHLELLDSVDPGEFDVDYLKHHNISFDVVDVDPQSVSTPVKKIPVATKSIPVVPVKITDEECAKLFPVNCRIIHKSFGLGIVRKIDDGIITIDFDKGGNRELGVDFCIKNKLLEKK